MRGREREDDNRGHATLFVDNLPDQMRKIWVYNLFCKFGKIREIFIPHKRSKITGRCFGFVRFEQGVEARIASEEVNGKWVWDQKLMVKMARFLRNRDYDQDGTLNSFDFEQRWNRGVIQSNPKRMEYDRNYVQGRIQKSFDPELERNRGVFQPNPKRQETVRKANQIQKIQVQKNPYWGLDNNRRNGRNKGKGVSHNGMWRRKEQPKETKQREESRDKEMWRRKEQPESSKQGGGKGKDQQQTTTNIQLQPVGNGWLYRSAVGRLRRLYSVEEMEEIFRKNDL